jgi:hypothetical protein
MGQPKRAGPVFGPAEAGHYIDYSLPVVRQPDAYVSRTTAE